MIEVDPNAFQFTQILHEYIDPMHRLTFYKVGDQIAAEETTCRIFERAWEDFERFKETNGRPRIWLYRLALDTINREGSHQDGSTAFSDRIPFGKGVDNTKLTRAILALPSVEQDLVILHEVEGLSDEDVSEITGLPLSWAKFAETLAKNRLLELLEQ